LKVDTHHVCNPDAIMKPDLGESIHQALELTNRVIGYVANTKAEIKEEYISKLKERLTQAVKDYDIATAPFNLEEFSKELKYLNTQPDLQNLTLRFVCKQIELPMDFQPGSEQVQVTRLNRAKSIERISYHRAKACADVLGDEEGIQLWKAVIAQLLKDDKAKAEKARQERLEQSQEAPPEVTLDLHKKVNIEFWSEVEIADFTGVIIDENRHLYRFDKCLTHEALKDLNDPDFAYLCSCYYGDAEGYNTGRIFHMRRTQTLHHGDFCDELYWDTRIYQNPEQPSP